MVDAAGDPRFKLELPAAQLELSLPPARSVPEAIAALPPRAATSPRPPSRSAASPPPACTRSRPRGRLNPGPRYERTEDEYGDVARRQLVCALQVHVAVGGADRSLAVYNGAAPWLPLIAALAANAPFHDGRDTGLASIRPKIAELLPRQGIPPAIATWEAFADALAWGAASGAVPEPRRWWWELRPHPAFGTLEVRVPDAQATVEDAAAVAALVHALVGWLAARHDAGEPLETRRHVAARGEPLVGRALGHGRRAGRPARPASARRRASGWRALLDELAPVAARSAARRAGDRRAARPRNGAARQREAAAADGGVRAVAAWLADAYVPGADYAAGRREGPPADERAPAPRPL